MDNTTSGITAYFRDAVVSQKTQQVEITADAFKVSLDSVLSGKVDPIDSHKLIHLNQKQKPSTITEINKNNTANEKTLNVIIAIRTLNVKPEGGIKHDTDINDLTSVFYAPAILSESGALRPEGENIPWIPRDFLSPLIDSPFMVGTVEAVDTFIASKTKEIKDIREKGIWADYITFVCDFWESVNHTKIKDNFIYNHCNGKEPLLLDEYLYIIPDNSITAIHHIKPLYEYAMKNSDSHNQLYKTLISMKAKTPSPPVQYTVTEMKNHTGQMGCSFALSPSQREAVHHFNSSEPGDILAVNGPPGTGKTTLLQSIVADMFVKHALKQQDPPVIVATSTNNQAVTNIIESFAATGSENHALDLDQHWIPGKNSFATYFPSGQKAKESIEKGFQTTSVKMDYTVAEWEIETNRKEAAKRFLSHCAKIFGDSCTTLDQCKERIWQLLCLFEETRKKMLDLAASIPSTININGTKNLNENIASIDRAIETVQAKDIKYKQRIADWTQFYKKNSLLRLFSGKNYKIKIENFISLDEQSFKAENLSLGSIESFYNEKLKENRDNYRGYQKAKELLTLGSTYEEFQINALQNGKETFSLSVESLDKLFDTNIRFYEFWLSVHYYECTWLLEEHKVSDDELFKNTERILNDKYKRLCMLTPCLVMTFYMLPANFKTYKNSSQGYYYDFIDLLIVDEAGQVSPEIGACSFLLAKKALIVGDIYQIEPVWSISRGTDISLAIGRNVVTADQFHLLEENGLNTSQSSLMKIACQACKYEKYGQKGLMLTEHRRCYDDLIQYCNQLVYNGKLEPKRGKACQDKKYPFPGTPPLTHIQVSTTKSGRIKTSRYNADESKAICQWIVKNFESLQTAYPNADPRTLLGIITPFKAQADYIRKELKTKTGDISRFVDVGTVHTFQGGERRVILFSTVYGAEDGCAFLDAKKNLMNVAMSRAKDRFIVFGDINCLSSSDKQPSGLLKSYF